MKRSLHLLRNNKMLIWLTVGLITAVAFRLLRHLLLAHVIVSVFSMVAILPLLNGMWHSIRAGHYGIDLPGVIAAVASVILHQYWVCFIIVFILFINDRIKSIVIWRVESKQRKLLEQLPSSVHIFRKRKLIDDDIKDARVGDEIEILPGEIVPLDCVILEGSGNFLEYNLTGETEPQRRVVGDTILNGTTNLEETIIAKVIRTASDSQYRQVFRIELTAVNSNSRLANYADRYSIMFMLGAYVIAVAAWLISKQPLRFLEVIIIVSPATFILGPLIALTRGHYQSVKHGIIIKTNFIFEQLANAKTFCFDKSNTLSHNIAEVDVVTSFKPFTQQEIEIYAASLLQRSSHTLANALKLNAVNNNLKLLRSKHVKELSGLGAEARIGSNDIVIGSLGLLKERGITFPKNFKPNKLTQTSLCVSQNGNLIGYITFKESYRSDIKPMLERLAKLGANKSLMMTDEDQSIALRIAKRLGLTDAKTTPHPGDKLLAIETIENRPVVFVGDGLHDAPILTAADVGIAIGARGSTVAGQVADVVIMPDNLRYTAFAMSIAKQVVKSARLAIIVAVCLSLVFALIMVTGKIQPLAGSLIRFGIEIVTLGGLLFYRLPNAPN